MLHNTKKQLFLIHELESISQSKKKDVLATRRFRKKDDDLFEAVQGDFDKAGQVQSQPQTGSKYRLIKPDLIKKFYIILMKN